MAKGDCEVFLYLAYWHERIQSEFALSTTCSDGPSSSSLNECTVRSRFPIGNAVNSSRLCMHARHGSRLTSTSSREGLTKDHINRADLELREWRSARPRALAPEFRASPRVVRKREDAQRKTLFFWCSFSTVVWGGEGSGVEWRGVDTVLSAIEVYSHSCGRRYHDSFRGSS